MPLLSCSSARRDYLAAFGYGTFALPKAGVPPLTLLAKRGGRLSPIGPLAVTFPPGTAPLPLIDRHVAAPVSGARSRGVDASIGLDVLGAAIGALSGSTLGVKAAYNKASKVEFEFGDVFENAIDINLLDAYLAASPVNPGAGPALRQLLEADEVHILTATLDASRISVTASDSAGASLSLQVPVIQQLVGGTVAVGGTGASSAVITYSSTSAPLAIGGQVVRLVFKGGKYQTLKLVAAKDGAIGLASSKRTAGAPSMLIEV